jgi:RNA polymerase primary sigma factor
MSEKKKKNESNTPTPVKKELAGEPEMDIDDKDYASEPNPLDTPLLSGADPFETDETARQRVDQAIQSIIEKGKKKGFLTYEELNDDLPDEVISPNQLDSLLMTLDEMGVQLLDEANVKKAPEEEEFEEPVQIGPEDEIAVEDLTLEEELAETEGRKIDDPVRMYLTQMGEIPLLTRDQEISLAKKIELTRMAFRRKVLECDYCARTAVEILQQVDEGALPFDRTMKMGSSEMPVRTTLKNRMPMNLATVTKLLDKNSMYFEQSVTAKTIEEARQPLKQMHRNRRKIATLLEELGLRTSRIQPMMKKLQSIQQKMHQLEQVIQAGPAETTLSRTSMRCGRN